MLRSHWLRSLVNRSNSRPSRPRKALRKPAPTVNVIELLEQRTMLSATPIGVETQVSATTGGVQVSELGGGQSVATAADGSYVAVWASSVGDMSGTPRWRWLKRWLPHTSSRSTSGVHRSATISAAFATGQNWPYPFMSRRYGSPGWPGKSNFWAFGPPQRERS